MKAWVIKSSKFTEIDQLQLLEVARPQPHEKELLVRVHDVGLNPVDYKLIEHQPGSWLYHHILGLDVAGEVVEIGKQVDKFKKGDRVFYHGDLTESGGFAEFGTVKSDVVAKMPDKLTYPQAAALLCSAMTAYQAIFRKANLENRHTVLIHAGAGGVGGIAIQLAKIAGLRVFTTVSKQKKDFVAHLHPDAIIDYRTQNVTEQIQRLTNGLGVDLIINTIGAEAATQDLKRLAYNGALIAIDGQPNLTTDYAKLGLGVFSVNLGGAHQSHNTQQRHDLAVMATQLGELVVKEKLDPLINQEISYRDIPKGLQMIKDHKVTGKIVAKFM